PGTRQDRHRPRGPCHGRDVHGRGRRGRLGEPTGHGPGRDGIPGPRAPPEQGSRRPDADDRDRLGDGSGAYRRAGRGSRRPGGCGDFERGPGGEGDPGALTWIWLVSLPLLTAVTPQYEAQLTTRLGQSRTVHVVRRCADLAELLGAAAAGVARVAVVSAELRGLDRAATQDLTDRGLLVLGVH